MPPGAMTVSMSADDLSSAGLYHRAGVRGGESPQSVRPDHRYSSDDVRHRKAGLSGEQRGHSWSRRQKRSCSKERGGAQLPTWAETRTTRLRRSKALGETQRPAAKKASGRQEAPPDEDAGHILMERIRVNSRCLKAQLSSHHSRRMVADVGTASRKAVKNGKGGVYTVHARRNRKESSEDDHQASDAEIESTTVKLVDEHGREEVSIPSNFSGEPQDSPEIVHHHILAVDGEDATRVGSDRMSERENTNGKQLDNISERGQTSSDSSYLDAGGSNRADHSRASSRGRSGGEELPASDLEEGRLVNRNGDLVIEVEVKEMVSSEGSNDTPASATLESNITPVPTDDPSEYDSYRVYSEQNYLTPPTDAPADSPPVRRSSRQDISARNENSRLERARQARGVYLRRMEHRNSQSNIHRSTDQGLEGAGETPVRMSGRNPRSISQNRKSGQRKLEKWSTSAASTGDLRDASWDYSNDKDRLLAVLSEARGESSLRQRRREDLLRRIKQLQSRAHQRREQVREMWRKRYLEAKKITPRLEEECSRLRQELEKLHRELLAKVQAGVWALLTISGKTERPSNKLSYKIMIARLLQEIEDLTRRVEGTRLKLHTEVKLRAMAEKDVRNLREELLKKKIQVTLTRNQEQAAIGNGLRQQYFISAV